MTQLGQPIPTQMVEVRRALGDVLDTHGYAVADADSVTTGRDFLFKIWELLMSVPLGVALIHEGMSERTMSNIFLEFGHMQASGKELLVIKTPDADVPSDLVRTEYVEWADGFCKRMNQFMEGLYERADYYVTMSELLEGNPVLAIDYIRRAFLITGDTDLRDRVAAIVSNAGLHGRAKTSVEALLAEF